MSGLTILYVEDDARAAQDVQDLMRASGDTPVEHGLRAVIFDDPATPVQTRIWRTRFPAPGARFVGPCIIEYPGQSAVLPPGASGEVDAFGNLHVRLAP